MRKIVKESLSLQVYEKSKEEALSFMENAGEKYRIELIQELNDAENYGRKLMPKAHRYGEMGFEMARLPQHISLKQPFAIPDLENTEVFFDGFAKELCPFDIEFVDMDIFSSNLF